MKKIFDFYEIREINEIKYQLGYFCFTTKQIRKKKVLDIERNGWFQMTDEDDEEVEMVMNRKSRFSRYRMRVRERKNLDISEIMIVDDPNNTSYALFCSFTFLYVILNH